MQPISGHFPVQGQTDGCSKSTDRGPQRNELSRLRRDSTQMPSSPQGVYPGQHCLRSARGASKDIFPVK